MTKTRVEPSWTDLSDAPSVVTVGEAARIARVCPRTIRAEIAAGRLRAVRFGRALRILKAELIRYLEGR